MSAAYGHCVNGLLTSIVWTLTGRLYDVYITDIIVYLLDVLVVIVYMSYCNCWDYLLLHENWGECSEDWAGACRWGGGGGIFNWKFFFAKKCSWGLKTRGVGKRYTSSYDHDMWPVKILERSGLAVKSYHSETLAAEELKKQKKIKKKNKKFWQNHKAFPAGSRECLNTSGRGPYFVLSDNSFGQSLVRWTWLLREEPVWCDLTPPEMKWNDCVLGLFCAHCLG